MKETSKPYHRAEQCQGEPVEPSSFDKLMTTESIRPNTDAAENRRLVLRYAGAAGALVMTITKDAHGQLAGVAFGEDINAIVPEAASTTYGAQLMNGVFPYRVKMTFAALQNPQNPIGYKDIYRKEFDVDDDGTGGIILRGVSPVTSVPGYNDPDASEQTLLELDRGDGRMTQISNPGGGLSGSYIDIDGQARFDKDADCPNGGVVNIHPGRPGELKVIVFNPIPSRPTKSDVDVAHVPDAVSQPDICKYIESEIARAEAMGQTPYDIGLYKRKESGAGDNLSAPEVDNFSIQTDRYTEDSNQTVVEYMDPATGVFSYMKRNTDGTWDIANPQSEGTFAVNKQQAEAMIKAETKTSGREVIVFTFLDINTETSRPYRNVMAFEQIGTTSFMEVPVTLEESATLADDDNDGVPNNTDNAPLRANPGQADTNFNGIGDAREANCELGGWPGKEAAKEIDPANGLRMCEDEMTPPVLNTRADENGSTFRSNTAIDNPSDGVVQLQEGEEFRFIHSEDPRTEGAPSPTIQLPTDTANSVDIRINDTNHLDGTPGEVTFTHNSLETGTEVQTFTGPTDWMHFDPGYSDTLSLEGSDVEIRVGTESIAVPECLRGAETCEDGSACTIDGCDSAAGCTHTEIPCEDESACTIDGCDSALGCTHTEVDCDDSNACTTDGCDGATGCTHADVSCEDNNACTLDGCDTEAGCTHTEVVCDDEDACTLDGCNGETGCEHMPVSCEDNNACTIDGCDSALGCTHEAVSCEDNNACTLDGCDTLAGCENEPVLCEDGSLCTTEICIPETGCETEPVPCDDGDPCTIDGCDPATGCTHTTPDCGGDDDAVPADDDEVPTDDDTIPADDDTGTDDDTAIADDDTAATDDDTATSDDDTSATDDDTAAADDDTAATDDDTAAADDDTTTTDDDTEVTDDDTAVSDDDAVVCPPKCITGDDDDNDTAETDDDVVTTDDDTTEVSDDDIADDDATEVSDDDTTEVSDDDTSDDDVADCAKTHECDGGCSACSTTTTIVNGKPEQMRPSLDAPFLTLAMGAAMLGRYRHRIGRSVRNAVRNVIARRP